MEFVAEERRTESLAAYYRALTDAQRDGLRAVAMDMWAPYIQATCTGLPDGEQRMVFDRFHIMREMTKAVDTGPQAGAPRVPAGWRGLAADRHHVRLVVQRRAASRASRRDLRHDPSLNLKVGRAWAIKEALRTLWTFRQGAAVKRFFSQRYGWAVRTRLEPVKKVAAMLKNYLDGVLRFVKHPITNGVAEGPNSQIMSIKRKAGGFRNAQNFTTAIYFHCGGLDLYPR